MKCFASGVEQFLVRGRIGDPHVVFRIDQAAAEEVLPVAVDQRRGEELVVLGGHPVDQRLPRIVVGRDRGRLGAQSGGRNRLLRLGIGRRGSAPVIHDPLFANLRARLALHAREEGREAVVVLLAPLFERMVMAAGTLDSQAQEQLGRVFDLLVAVLHFAIPGHRRVLADFAGRGQQLPHDLVVGNVGVQAVANPVVEDARAAGVGSRCGACSAESNSTCWRK